jgi:hypothetical protein
MTRLACLSALTALLAAASTLYTTPARAASIVPPTYSQAVTQICAHALLFEKSHSIGSRTGALEVAADIRASSRTRLARVAALPAGPAQRAAIARWLVLEQRLADAYALDYVRIYNVIAEPRASSAQEIRAARRLANLVHDPDQLRLAAARLEQELGVPDCTGG